MSKFMKMCSIKFNYYYLPVSNNRAGLGSRHFCPDPVPTNKMIRILPDSDPKHCYLEPAPWAEHLQSLCCSYYHVASRCPVRPRWCWQSGPGWTPLREQAAQARMGLSSNLPRYEKKYNPNILIILIGTFINPILCLN